MNWIAGQTHVNKSQKNGPDPWCSNSDKHIEKAFAPVFNAPFMEA